MNSEQLTIHPKPVTDNAGSNLNIKDIIYKYLHYWWLFVIVVVVALTGAWLYLRYSTPVYSVKSSLLIRSEQGRGAGGGAEDMFADIALFQSSVNKQNEIEILLSRTMMERVVRSLNLQEDYYVTGNVKQTNIYEESPFDLKIISLKDSSSSFAFNIEITGEQTFKINNGTSDYYFGQRLELPPVDQVHH